MLELLNREWFESKHPAPLGSNQSKGGGPHLPTYRLSVEERQQQLQPWEPRPHPAPRQIVPWIGRSVRRRLVGRSPTPQLTASRIKPVQVPEISSEFMESNIEVVEELSQPPPVQARPTPTKPGDVTSTTDPELGVPRRSSATQLPILDLSDEHVCLNNVHEEVVREAMEYISRMNTVGVFLESLGIGPVGF